jgi:hypothetical protein
MECAMPGAAFGGAPSLFELFSEPMGSPAFVWACHCAIADSPFSIMKRNNALIAIFAPVS